MKQFHVVEQQADDRGGAAAFGRAFSHSRVRGLYHTLL
jgi:hypothetical protein